MGEPMGRCTTLPRVYAKPGSTDRSLLFNREKDNIVVKLYRKPYPIIINQVYHRLSESCLAYV
ncbi:hypothetical protein HI914_07082 [Erysiphe necator]|nr:hypothetical protein HI914_07082 [Erysiphe necator]